MDSRILKINSRTICHKVLSQQLPKIQPSWLVVFIQRLIVFALVGLIQGICFSENKLLAQNHLAKTYLNGLPESLVNSDIENKFNKNGTPLTYMRNTGQLADDKGDQVPDVKYYVNQGDMRVFIRNTGLTYVFFQTTDDDSSKNIEDRQTGENSSSTKRVKNQNVIGHRVDLNFVGANHNAEFHKVGQTTLTERVYRANCPNGAVAEGTDLVKVMNVYDGIDLILYTKDGHLKYDWLVKKGADHQNIKLEIVGADNFSINDYGQLEIVTSLGIITESAPEIFQGQKMIQGNFEIQNDLVGFHVSEYDLNKDLLIDPTREWATYLGGTSSEGRKTGCAVDGDGNVYMSSSTTSINFPTTIGAFQNTNGGARDVYLSKFNSNGDLLWSTYFGGSGSDFADGGLAVDNDNNVVVFGDTNSDDLPVTAGAFQNTRIGFYDFFVAKFNSEGELMWSTYFGGSNEDYAKGCTFDGDGNIYSFGETESTNMTVTTGAFQSSKGGFWDTFVFKMSPSGSLLWATYFGGSANDFARGGCAVGPDGNLVIFGDSYSENLFTNSSSFQSDKAGDFDCFLTKIDNSGQPIWSTYFGGVNNDFSDGGVAIGRMGEIYVQGYTTSPNLPMIGNSFQSAISGGSDVFMCNFDNGGNPVWSTYYGGGQNDPGNGGICLGYDGSVFATGRTASSDFPVTTNAFQDDYAGALDFYLLKFNPDGNRDYATFYGGSEEEFAPGRCATDNSGNIYFTGNTWSIDFPTSTGAYQQSISEGSDAVLVSFNFPLNCTVSAECNDISLTLNSLGTATITPEDVNNGSFVSCGTPILSLSQTAFDCSHVGTQTVTLTVEDEFENMETCMANITVALPTNSPAIGSTLYCTIQDAIDAANEGDVIVVPSGTYTENLNFSNKHNLTLLGAQAGVSAGVGAVRDENTTIGESIIDGTITTGSGTSGWPEGLTIDGFRLENASFTSAIRVQGDVEITNCIVHHTSTYFMISVGGNVGTEHTLTLSNSNINGQRGFSFGNARITAGVVNNNVFNTTSANLISASALDGIATVTNNEFNGPRGINVLTNSNTFTGNTFNVTAGGSNRGIDLYEVTGNNISGNAFNAGALSIKVLAGGREEAILDNTIEYNALLGGVENTTTKPVVATCNWWGTAVGSGIAGLMQGDVNFTPWLITNDFNNPDCPLQLTINGTAIINMACNEGTQVEIGIYDGTDEIVLLNGELDASGAFQESYSIPAGTYDVYAKIDRYLAKGFANVNMEEQSAEPTITLTEVIPGDIAGGTVAFNDNVINGQDMSLVIAHYNTIGAADRPDLNCDGQVDAIDLSFVAFYYFTQGANPE